MTAAILAAVLVTAALIGYLCVVSAHPLACGLGVVALGGLAIAIDCVRDARRGRV